MVNGLSKTKLELTWIGKENRPRLEPRILVEDAEKSYHAPFRTGESDIFDNRLIFGDNLLALKALEQEFMTANQRLCREVQSYRSRRVLQGGLQEQALCHCGGATG